VNATLAESLDVQHHIKRGRRLARHVWAHFKQDRCFEEAASLGYTSLLAMVPLLAVVFGVVSVFPVFEKWSSRLQDFIFRNFLPESGEQIVPHINSFLDSVSSLTLPGTITLILTALFLMVRIEGAFNRIWRVDRSRTMINRIIMYWAILTLAPLLMAAAIALGAQQVLGRAGFLGEVPQWLNAVGIFILTWMVFALFFIVIPNRSVKFRHALVGALVTTILFTLARAGFVAYVSNASYNVIYGALATVPIFLFWLYLVWTVVLLGASLAASLTTFSDYRRYDSSWPERWEFQLAYRLLGHLGAAQARGRALSREELMEREQEASELQIVRLLSELHEQRMVTRDEDGNWLLLRDLESVTLGELYCLGNFFLPAAETADLPRSSPWDEAYIAALDNLRQSSEAFWTQPLTTLYAAGGPAEDEE